MCVYFTVLLEILAGLLPNGPSGRFLVNWLIQCRRTLCHGAPSWTLFHLVPFCFGLISVTVDRNAYPGCWMEPSPHARPQLANMGEAAWPFLNSHSMWARSGQLFCCSWCVLHPVRLLLAVWHTHTYIVVFLPLTIHSLEFPPVSPIIEQMTGAATASVERMEKKEKAFTPKKWFHVTWV